jgi:hypothetical protein
MEIADNTEQKLWKEWNRAVLGQIAMAENDFNPGWPDSARSMVLVSKRVPTLHERAPDHDAFDASSDRHDGSAADSSSGTRSS